MVTMEIQNLQYIYLHSGKLDINIISIFVIMQGYKSFNNLPLVRWDVVKYYIFTLFRGVWT